MNPGPPRRKVGKGPFIFVFLVLAIILVFVSYPLQNIFMGGASPFTGRNRIPPRKGRSGICVSTTGMAFLRPPTAAH
jgi:hypothetical protein